MKEITKVQREFIKKMIKFYYEMYSEDHVEIPKLEFLLKNGKYSTSETTFILPENHYTSDKDFLNSWKSWYVRKRKFHPE